AVQTQDASLIVQSMPVAATDIPASPAIDQPIRLALALQGNANSALDAIAVRIAARSASGESRFTIRLDPPKLGRIEVNLNVSTDGQAQAALSVEKPQTLDLLQRDASALERALRDSGLDLAGGLSFSLKGEGRSTAWRDDETPTRVRGLDAAA